MTGVPRGTFFFFDFFSAATPADASATTTATKAASTRVLLFRDIYSGRRRRRTLESANARCPAPLLLVVDAGERSDSTNSQRVLLCAKSSAGVLNLCC